MLSNNVIGYNLRTLRQSAGLTRERLAERTRERDPSACVSRATIANVELGRCESARSKTLEILAKALDVPVTRLYRAMPSGGAKRLESAKTTKRSAGGGR